MSNLNFEGTISLQALVESSAGLWRDVISCFTEICKAVVSFVLLAMCVVLSAALVVETKVLASVSDINMMLRNVACSLLRRRLA